MLKYLFPLILFIHGLLHLIGFAKAFNHGKVTQLTKAISRPMGSLWLFTALLLFVTALLLIMRNEGWAYIAILSVVISQVLIITVWKDAKFGTVLNIIIILVAIASSATYRFEMAFKSDVKRHMDETNFTSTEILREGDLAALPLPVQKYIHYSGSVNKPKIKNMKVVFDGEMREKGKDFFKFLSVQYNFFDEPTRLFFMKARMYGTTVPGYHLYQNQRSTMQIKLLGLINVVNIKGEALNKAETVTVFNDMCLMAPATLIDKRITWTSLDSLSAKATFTNGSNKITAILYFNGIGQLINFVSQDRYAIGDMAQHPFSTPVKEYAQADGRHMWKYGETIWHYPDGEFVYGKFSLKSIEYNTTRL